MEHTAQHPSKLVRFFKALNYRVIKTSYLKAAIYFIITLAICLIAYYLFTKMPIVL